MIDSNSRQLSDLLEGLRAIVSQLESNIDDIIDISENADSTLQNLLGLVLGVLKGALMTAQRA